MMRGDLLALVPGRDRILIVFGFGFTGAEMRRIVIQRAGLIRTVHVAVRQFGFKVMGFLQLCFAVTNWARFQFCIHFFLLSDGDMSLYLISFDNLGIQAFSCVLRVDIGFYS
jgi:hypothetical protein